MIMRSADVVFWILLASSSTGTAARAAAAFVKSAPPRFRRGFCQRNAQRRGVYLNILTVNDSDYSNYRPYRSLAAIWKNTLHVRKTRDFPVLALECIQCDKNAAWYSEEEHERHIELCQNGLVAPTPCRNQSHTHCIVSWYRSGGSKERVVTERKCGGEEDVTGCTLYNSKISRKVRHLLSKDHSSGTVRRETSTLFVEVCSESCPGGECLSVAPTTTTLTLAISLLLSMPWL